MTTHDLPTPDALTAQYDAGQATNERQSAAYRENN
jgi:hypothetical protein